MEAQVGEPVLTHESLAEWLIDGSAECLDHQVAEKTFTLGKKRVSFLLQEDEGTVKVHAFIVAPLLSVLLWTFGLCGVSKPVSPCYHSIDIAERCELPDDFPIV